MTTSSVVQFQDRVLLTIFTVILTSNDKCRPAKQRWTTPKQLKLTLVQKQGSYFLFEKHYETRNSDCMIFCATPNFYIHMACYLCIFVFVEPCTNAEPINPHCGQTYWRLFSSECHNFYVRATIARVGLQLTFMKYERCWTLMFPS